MSATRCTKDEDKPGAGQCTPGAGLIEEPRSPMERTVPLTDRRHGQVPPDKPAFQPYRGKPAVRLIGGTMETAASFEVRNAPSSYPTVNCLRSHAESAKMGRLGPYNNTTAPIACSVRAQTFTFSVLFEVPLSRLPAARICNVLTSRPA